MKRDMDTMRQLLRAVEALPAGESLTELDNIDWQDFAQYARWLHEAGLVEASFTSTNADTAAEIDRLTWEGCDMLDAMRSDTIWAKVKEAILKPGRSFTADLLKELLKAEISQGLPTLRKLGE